MGVASNCLHRSLKDGNENEEESKRYSHGGVLANLFRISNVILCYSSYNVILSLSSTKGKDLVIGFVARTLKLSHP